jgi:hypothetical protein
MAKGRQPTEEQKVAKKLTDLVKNVELDLDEVGKAIGNAHTTVTYNRLLLIIESAVQEKEEQSAKYSIFN